MYIIRKVKDPISVVSDDDTLDVTHMTPLVAENECGVSV